jgi:hypothetical protein
MLLKSDAPTLKTMFELAERVELNIVEEQVRAIGPLIKSTTTSQAAQKVVSGGKPSKQEKPAGTKFVPFYVGQSSLNGACYKCGRYGHIARDCPKKGQQGSSIARQEVVQCDNCGRRGHTQDRCFELFPELRTQTRGDRQQKKQFGKGGHQRRGPENVRSSGASEADMAAKIEVLEKQFAASLALRGDESSDQRKDWMMAGTTQVEPIKANAVVTRGKGKAQEPRGAEVELDPQRGEGGRQARLPQSFLLSEVTKTPCMVPTPIVPPSTFNVGVGPAGVKGRDTSDPDAGQDISNPDVGQDISDPGEGRENPDPST